MAVNLINSDDNVIKQTNDDIQIEFSQSRKQQIEEIENNVAKTIETKTTSGSWTIIEGQNNIVDLYYTGTQSVAITTNYFNRNIFYGSINISLPITVNEVIDCSVNVTGSNSLLGANFNEISLTNNITVFVYNFGTSQTSDITFYAHFKAIKNS